MPLGEFLILEIDPLPPYKNVHFCALYIGHSNLPHTLRGGFLHNSGVEELDDEAQTDFYQTIRGW